MSAGGQKFLGMETKNPDRCLRRMNRPHKNREAPRELMIVCYLKAAARPPHSTSIRRRSAGRIGLAWRAYVLIFCEGAVGYAMDSTSLAAGLPRLVCSKC